MHIIFPKPVLRLRANPEYIDWTRSKALVRQPHRQSRCRLSVMASGAVSIGGGIAVKVDG
ncbi:MAG: hypothetical protein MIO93_06325 [ANME-2 cluster archaeon]|nr:hypothetical protein [ANME-2 cluster archaeon]